MMKEISSPCFKAISIVTLTIVLAVTAYLIIYDPADFRDEPYGAGDYYYTDVEGFGELFLGENSSIGTNHPIIFFVLFIAWGAACWYFLRVIESKSKNKKS